MICKPTNDRYDNRFEDSQLGHSRSKWLVGLVANKKAIQY